MFVNNTFVLTKVDGCDSEYVQKLASDGHSGTTGHWTVQWPHVQRHYTQSTQAYIRSTPWYKGK